MGAGGSAGHEARRARAQAEEHMRQARLLTSRADCFDVASRTEAELAAHLELMAKWGWRTLVDRAWPGRGRANIDLIHVGPGGVLVIDVKCWAEPDVVGGRLYRGQADAQDDVDAVSSAAEAVTDATAELGLAASEVIPAMVFMNQVGTDIALGRVRLLDESTVVPFAVHRGARLTPEQVDRVVQLLDERFPPYRAAVTPVSATVLEPVLPLARHERIDPDALFDVDALTDALLATARSKPIEDWMTFLHPDQVQLVRRLGPGPARIRGAAGTGKTVVALHHAVRMAEATNGRVLFTTYMKTLPPVLASLHDRLSPATVEAVDYVNLHKWALDLLKDRGNRPRVDGYGAENAFARAWSRCGKGTAHRGLGVEWTYWRDEIDHVIKGRGITSFEQYRDLARVGRRTPLTVAQREIVWAVYSEYDRQLRERSIIDFNDVLAWALTELRHQPLDEPYAAVVADEVQDLNCLGVRLLAEIAGGGTRLLLVGDGQQQIFPGGYTLAEAGLSVVGRSTVLRTNYRNARAILAAARDVVTDGDFPDADEDVRTATDVVTTVHDGGIVVRESAATSGDLRAAVVMQIRRWLDAGHALAGMAVLVSTNAEVTSYRDALAAVGIETVSLRSYRGVATDAVKVGTLQRAKGLEFKDVLHPVSTRRTSKALSSDARQEQEELDRRALFVAMTRARDALWIGSVTTAA